MEQPSIDVVYQKRQEMNETDLFTCTNPATHASTQVHAHTHAN